MSDVTGSSNSLSIYEHNPALETLPQIKARDAKDYPEHYTNPWATCAMEDRHWLLGEIERLQDREREAFRLANAATYLVAPKYALHAELKAFMDGQISKPEDYSGHEPPAVPSPFDILTCIRDEIGVELMDTLSAGTWTRAAEALLKRFRAAQPPVPEQREESLEHEAGGSRERGTSPNRSCGTAGQSGPASSLQGAPPDATHYQPEQEAYYKQLPGGEWLVWSREERGWMRSAATSEQFLVKVKP